MRELVRKAEKTLCARDPVLDSLINSHGPCTLFDNTGLINKPAFHVLVWAIINQQLSVASARSIENRLFALHPRRTFSQKHIEQLSDPQLASCGLSKQKIAYIRILCEAVEKKQIRLQQLRNTSDTEIASTLGQLKGIGPWTIDMYLIFSLGRLDVLPLGDLALRKSIRLHYNLDEKSDVSELEQIAEKWRPYRTIASWYLWAAVD